MSLSQLHSVYKYKSGRLHQKCVVSYSQELSARIHPQRIEIRCQSIFFPNTQRMQTQHLVHHEVNVNNAQVLLQTVKCFP